MIHLYYGDGKGKTTAAIGLAVRASGHGKRVLICRFLKDNSSGELDALKMLKNVTVLDCACMEGFMPHMCDEERAAASQKQSCAFEQVCLQIKDGGYDMAVLDEVLWLSELGVIPEGKLKALMEAAGGSVELVLTGGKASEALCACADYVTHMTKISHPYDSGTAPREGVEF